MNELNPVAVGDVVELMTPDGRRDPEGLRVTVDRIDVHKGETYVTYLNPKACEDCDCDPYATTPLSSVRPVVSG